MHDSLKLPESETEEAGRAGVGRHYGLIGDAEWEEFEKRRMEYVEQYRDAIRVMAEAELALVRSII